MNAFVKALAGLALAIAAGTAVARADVLALAANADRFAVTATEQLVPLTQGGAKAVTFNTTRDNTIVVVIYNADCALNADIADINTKWLSVRITVDGIDAYPQKGKLFAMCSAADTTLLNDTAASRQAVIRVAGAGTHRVRVFASLQGAKTGFLYDSSIVIKD